MEEKVPNAGLYDDDDSDPELVSPRLHHHRRQQKKTAFLAGFRDCHQEVLRYLVSIEQVPLEGPVVFGLEKHLTDLETFMQSSIGCDDDDVSGSCEQLRQGFGGTTTVVVGSPKVCQTAGASVVDGDEEHGEVSAKNNIPIDESSFDSGCDSSLGGSTCADLSMDVVVVVGGSEEEAPPSRRPDGEADDERQRADDTTIGESELAENALELMHLANGNPRISRILNELFALMDNDYYDDSDDDDDDGIEMEEADGINLESL